jgi:hypothetical protein
MIRIEGIPIVAARLAATLKSTKAIEPSRPVSRHRTQEKQSPIASKTVRARRQPTIAQVCA